MPQTCDNFSLSDEFQSVAPSSLKSPSFISSKGYKGITILRVTDERERLTKKLEKELKPHGR
jgi:hypothetical protein